MFERFTERARRVIILAREEAGRRRHDVVGTEHVLLGLIRDGEGMATAVLQRRGPRLENVKAEVQRTLDGLPKTTHYGEVPFTPQARRVLELSIDAVLGQGDPGGADAMLAPEILVHLRSGDVQGLPGVQRHIAVVRETIPDITFTVEDLFGEGDRVAVAEIWGAFDPDGR